MNDARFAIPEERAPRELAHLMAIAVATHPLKSYAAPGQQAELQDSQSNSKINSGSHNKDQ